jgi:transposase InsO family protein
MRGGIEMLDEDMRTAVALKRYAIISPILNGQVRSIRSYCADVGSDVVEMPYYGPRRYAPSTIESWYSDYIKGGIDALKPRVRSDKGTTRVVDAETSDAIVAMCKKHPKAPVTVIYDELLAAGAFLKSELSLSTLRRFIAKNIPDMADGQCQERLRFSVECANGLWQTDVMYGPYVKGPDGRRSPTYLLAYIDDATRLITHAAFYLSQDITALRASFKEALLRRGIPKTLYTDNGRIYRSQSFGYLCAQVKVVLLHTGVRDAAAKGKIERFFRTVRLRFLSRISEDDLASPGALNAAFSAWLDSDYQRKPHDGLDGLAPLDAFLTQSASIRLVEDMVAFNEAFLLRCMRKVRKDATISLGNILYETGLELAGARVEVRYDPLSDGGFPPELFVYRDGKPLSCARRVDFAANAHRRRRRSQAECASDICTDGTDSAKTGIEDVALAKKHTIHYRDIKGGSDV